MSKNKTKSFWDIKLDDFKTHQKINKKQLDLIAVNVAIRLTDNFKDNWGIIWECFNPSIYTNFKGDYSWQISDKAKKETRQSYSSNIQIVRQTRTTSQQEMKLDDDIPHTSKLVFFINYFFCDNSNNDLCNDLKVFVNGKTFVNTVNNQISISNTEQNLALEALKYLAKTYAPYITIVNNNRDIEEVQQKKIKQKKITEFIGKKRNKEYAIQGEVNERSCSNKSFVPLHHAFEDYFALKDTDDPKKISAVITLVKKFEDVINTFNNTDPKIFWKILLCNSNLDNFELYERMLINKKLSNEILNMYNEYVKQPAVIVINKKDIKEGESMLEASESEKEKSKNNPTFITENIPIPQFTKTIDKGITTIVHETPKESIFSGSINLKTTKKESTEESTFDKRKLQILTDAVRLIDKDLNLTNLENAYRFDSELYNEYLNQQNIAFILRIKNPNFYNYNSQTLKPKLRDNVLSLLYYIWDKGINAIPSIFQEILYDKKILENLLLEKDKELKIETTKIVPKIEKKTEPNLFAPKKEEKELDKDLTGEKISIAKKEEIYKELTSEKQTSFLPNPLLGTKTEKTSQKLSLPEGHIPETKPNLPFQTTTQTNFNLFQTKPNFNLPKPNIPQVPQINNIPIPQQRVINNPVPINPINVPILQVIPQPQRDIYDEIVEFVAPYYNNNNIPRRILRGGLFL